MTATNITATNTPRVTVIDPRVPEKAKLRVAAYARVSSDSEDQVNSYIAQVDFYSKHIAGKEEWEMVDIYADEGISELDGQLNFYMDCSFDPDEVFGTHVDSADNNNWLNIYAEYDLENSQVCDALKVILCREDGFDYEMAYQLNAEEKSAILDKMDQYCREKYGQSLLEFAAEIESEITAMETPQM